jgi:ribosomal protein S18 acetylase RimI-like enzyme
MCHVPEQSAHPDARNISSNLVPGASDLQELKSSDSMSLEILQAASAVHIESARELFNQYAASLNFNLCFQSFEHELASLPGNYAPPAGRLFLAFWKGEAIGCGALRKFVVSKNAADQAAEDADNICEMKRLYVKPEGRGHRIGLALAERLISEARACGYLRMRLDTVPATMAVAVKMYRAFGFQEIAPYGFNPTPGAIFMELKL